MTQYKPISAHALLDLMTEWKPSLCIPSSRLKELRNLKLHKGNFLMLSIFISHQRGQVTLYRCKTTGGFIKITHFDRDFDWTSPAGLQIRSGPAFEPRKGVTETNQIAIVPLFSYLVNSNVDFRCDGNSVYGREIEETYLQHFYYIEIYRRR